MEDNKRKAPNAETLEPVEEESSFDIRRIFTLIVLNWQWFLLSLFIFVSGALIYLRYTTPVHQMSTKMLIKDESIRRNTNQILGNMPELGFVSNSAGIDNEIEILKSRVIALEAVKDLKLYTEYLKEGRLKKVLLYKDRPFTVDLDEESLKQLDEIYGSVSFKITKDKEYHLESSDGSYRTRFASIPVTINTPYGKLTISPNENAYKENKYLALAKNLREQEKDEDEDKQTVPGKGYTVYVNITSPTLVAINYASKLSVEPTTKFTSIAMLTINDQNIDRATDYLKQLAICYNQQANADKNEIAMKTEEFINTRLQKISEELGATESELENYKRRNNLVQIKLDATQTMTQANAYYGQLIEATTQIQILDDLRQYMANPSNKYQIIPSNIGLKDVASSALITQYNKTVLDRNRLLASASENSPVVTSKTEELENLTSSIHEALRQARRTADIERKGIERQYNEFQTRIENTPTQERVLTQIGRQQEVKSGLYLMLLQKREENSISLAATADKGRLIDEPVYMGKVKPKGSIIVLIAAILGFAIPLLLTYLLQLMRYKIEGHEDVAQLTKLPIIADVAVANENAKSASGIVVRENENNQIDEIFRSMRTNIQFMLKEGEKVILFTSSTSGEGKTFNASNLATSFALLGKKVILLGLDIRKPALGRLFNVSDRNTGITNLLVKDSVSEADLQNYIKHSGVNNNLDLLLAGPTPPNPTELLARENLKEIITILRTKYDYIILDTAPVGLVTDTLQIAPHADVTVFVCRADYTPKSSFGYINALHAENKMPNMSIIINGIDMSKKKYGYYYGYGKYGKYGRYGYSSYASSYGNYGNYGSYGNYASSHYGKKDDNSIKK